MSLKKYWQKRKFDKTTEPKGKVVKTKKQRFVVQEHQARNLHWDFRLEMAGVLKSWAVPKGVPKKVGLKRLAVQTENHPVDYINFSGIIPKGSYGAGTVKIFDKGMYELIDRGRDKIIFDLSGKKLKGKYSLIKFRKPNQWLLFRMR